MFKYVVITCNVTINYWWGQSSAAVGGFNCLYLCGVRRFKLNDIMMFSFCVNVVKLICIEYIYLNHEQHYCKRANYIYSLLI